MTAILRADTKCRKFRTGEIPWSPKYQLIKNRIEFWNLMVKQLSGGKVHGYYLKRKKKAARLQHIDVKDIKQAKSMRATAYREDKRIRKTASKERQTFTRELAEAKAQEGNLTAAKYLDQMNRTETQRRNSRLIRFANNKVRGQALSRVIAQDADGQMKEHTSKAEIEEACLLAYGKRIRQASDTPFMIDPLYNCVGPLGFGPASKEILDGTFICPEGTDPHAKKLIDALQRPANVQEQPLTFSLPTYKRRWKRSREGTASGPSVQKFSHCIAGSRDDLVAQMEAQMAHIPFRGGYSPERWRHAMDVMLEKQKGNVNVDKLRTIVLMEAAFNDQNKALGRSMMYYAEQQGIIAKEQFGSRKRMSAIEHCVNKRLTFDLWRQKKRPGALCANDAKSCYDRITHSVASLSMQRAGVPPGPIISMFSTIQQMSHHIRTMYGDSTQSFNCDNGAKPVQGVCQGNGGGPQIWAVVSTPVLDMMRVNGHGIHFKAALSGEEVSFVGYAFVDDTDIGSSSLDKHASADDVTNQLQEALIDWEGGIRATGGALVPDKTHWFLISFLWKEGKWTYASSAEAPGEIAVKDSTGTQRTLRRLEPSAAERTLGVRLAPDGNNTAQYQHMRDLSNEWADRIRTGHLPRHLVWQSLQTTILKSLAYPLPATTLTEKQCLTILQPVLIAGLPRAGIARTFPRAVVYGPSKFGGLGIPHLYCEQHLDQIEMIIKFSKNSTQLTGQLFRLSLEQLQLETGIPRAAMRLPFKIFKPMVTPCLLTQLWEFLSQHDMRLETEPTTALTSRRGDSYIIERFIQAGFSGQELGRLNRCRLYLQVLTVADITTGDGKRIRRECLTGTSKYPSEYDWPTQGNPPKHDWTFWQQSLTNTFGRNGTLTHPLGNWTTLPVRWQWFFDAGTERLYRNDAPNIAEMFIRKPGRPSRNSVMRFEATSQLREAIPAEAVPATVEQVRRVLVLTGYANIEPTPTLASPTTLREAVNRLPQTSNWAVTDFKCADEGKHVAQAIKDGTCIAVSDGSYKNARGTACWIIEGPDPKYRVFCPHGIPGNATDQTAYRSELGGLYGISTMIKVLCDLHNIKQGETEIACDGLSALRRVTESHHVVRPRDKQFDIIEATRNVMASSPITWKHRHVKGHQDDFYGPLDRWSTLNVLCDLWAKDRWAEANPLDNSLPQTIHGEPWSLWIQDRKICNQLRASVTEHVLGPPCIDYWIGKGKMDAGNTTSIDWNVLEKAKKMVTLNRRHWVAKHATGFCATGKTMLRRGQWDTAACPRCHHEVEDAAHVTRCPEQDATKVWTKAIAKLEQWLGKQKTQRQIKTALIIGIQAWRSGTEPTHPPYSFPGLQETVDQQTRIGWQGLMEHFPASGWAETQQRYFEWLGSRKTGKRWMAALISKLWDIAWDMWDHRNDVVHRTGNDKDSIKLNKEIREELRTGHARLPADAQLVFRRGRSLLTAAPDVRRAWLMRIRAARKTRQSRDRRRRSEGDKQIMYSWLGLSR